MHSYARILRLMVDLLALRESGIEKRRLMRAARVGLERLGTTVVCVLASMSKRGSMKQRVRAHAVATPDEGDMASASVRGATRGGRARKGRLGRDVRIGEANGGPMRDGP